MAETLRTRPKVIWSFDAPPALHEPARRARPHEAVADEVLPRVLGRPRKMTPDQVAQALELRTQKRSIRNIANVLKVKKSTVGRELRSAEAPIRTGRPPVPMPDLESVRKLKGEGFSVARIATQLNTTAWAVRKALKHLGVPPHCSEADPQAVPQPPAPEQHALSDVLPAVLAALSAREWEAVWRLASSALQGDYMLALVRGVYHDDRVAGAQVLARVVELRAGVASELAEDAKPDAVVDSHSSADSDLGAVLLVGGIGRMLPHYRAETERWRMELVYIEKASAAAKARIDGRGRGQQLRAVLVFTAVCAHSLREAAQEAAAAAGAPIHYLNGNPSVLKLRAALTKIGAGQ